MCVRVDDIRTYLCICDFNDARQPMSLMQNGNSMSALKLFKFIYIHVCIDI